VSRATVTCFTVVVVVVPASVTAFAGEAISCIIAAAFAVVTVRALLISRSPLGATFTRVALVVTVTAGLTLLTAFACADVLRVDTTTTLCGSAVAGSIGAVLVLVIPRAAVQHDWLIVC